MLPIPPKYKLLLLVVLSGAVAALQNLAKLEPGAAWATSIGQMLLLLEAFLTTPQGAADQIRALQHAARVMVLGCFFAGMATACQGCTNGQPPPVVAPSVNLAVCIFDQYATSPACRP